MNAEELKFPQVKADINECRKYIDKIEEVIWNPKVSKKDVILNIPPRYKDWDVQLIAALDELEYYRELENSFQRSFEKFV